MLVAVRVFLVADADGAEDRQLPHLQPEVGDGGQRAGVAFRGIRLVVDVDLIDEVILCCPVVDLVHPALDTEPGAAEIDGVGQPRVEATFVGQLVGAGGGGERGGVDLRAATDLDTEILVGGLLGEPIVPEGSEAEVAADFVGLFGLVLVFLAILAVAFLRLAVGWLGIFCFDVLGLREWLDRVGRLLLQLLQTHFEFGDAPLFRIERVCHLLERLQARGDAGEIERLWIGRFCDQQEGIGGEGECRHPGARKQAEARQDAAAGNSLPRDRRPCPSC